MDLRKTILRAAVALTALGVAAPAPAQHHSEAPPAPPAIPPAILAELGSAVPAERAERLSELFHVPSVGAASGEQPLLTALKDVSGSSGARFEISEAQVDLVTISYGRIHFDNAHVALMPAADGRSCRFELSGAPLAAGTMLEATGTIHWANGPYGGDTVEAEYRLTGAPIDALRTLLPNRFDPSLSGNLDLHGTASGVVGETTSEEVPATPLRGELVATAPWQVLGRTDTLTVTTAFSLDDRLMRLRDGHMKWSGYELGLQGWFDPLPTGKYELQASFSNVDAKAVAADWKVPEPFRPDMKVTGRLQFSGVPGKGGFRLFANAPSLDVPLLGGWPVHVTNAAFSGSLLAINAEVALSIRPGDMRLGNLDLGSIPFGLQWFEGTFRVSNGFSTLWNGDSTGALSYTPADHPKFSVTGQVKHADVKQMVAAVAPQLGLDVDGAGAATSELGQDKDRNPVWNAHASLVAGRIGNLDLAARVVDALAAADPALPHAADLASLLPHSRKGTIGTRVDRLFLELSRSADVYSIGGLVLHSGDFQLDADGSWSQAAGLALDGTVAVPGAVASRLAQSASWLAPLVDVQAGMIVPVTISGPSSSPTVALAPGYSDLLAKARRGEPVTRPPIKNVRHVGTSSVFGTIPGDPNATTE
ncbi:MAG TPA: hypothetical protein VGK20_00475 [Candidatus Binatia bacterium]|jgi:hypothetical protein